MRSSRRPRLAAARSKSAGEAWHPGHGRVPPQGAAPVIGTNRSRSAVSEQGAMQA
ncbi:hypothetical protein [Lysobacter gummosus]|uniref:hypothetical protein n=1 Tax=Lysobacter gummosus TaxID=262324 RepID=UPI00362AD0B8